MIGSYAHYAQVDILPNAHILTLTSLAIHTSNYEPLRHIPAVHKKPSELPQIEKRSHYYYYMHYVIMPCLYVYKLLWHCDLYAEFGCHIFISYLHTFY